jgi:hypothetical protein
MEKSIPCLHFLPFFLEGKEMEVFIKQNKNI